MEKNKIEIVLAAVFFLTGIFLIIFSQGRVTGGVVGAVDITSAGRMFFGMMMMFAGIALYINGKDGLRGIVNREHVQLRPNVVPLRDVADYVGRVEPKKERRVLVLDTGFFVENKNHIKVSEFLQQYTHIYTIREAWNTVHDDDMRKVLRQHGVKLFNEAFIEQNQKDAREYLDDSEKAKLAYDLLPYFKQHNPKIPVNRAEAAEVVIRLKDLMGRIKASSGKGWEKGNWDLDAAAGFDDFFRNAARQYLEKDCGVSEGDIELVTVAKSLADENGTNYVFVYSTDSHIEDAIRRIRDKNPGLKPRLRYLDVMERIDEESDKEL
jgi:hypothetical protein